MPFRFSFSAKEGKHNIVCLPLTNFIPSSLENFFKPENLNNDNRWFCNLWDSLQDSVRDCNVMNHGSICIIWLVHYVIFQGKLIKDNRKVKCPSGNLSLLVCADNVSISRIFKLRATINHSVTINAGHCWAFIGTQTIILGKSTMPPQ